MPDNRSHEEGKPPVHSSDAPGPDLGDHVDESHGKAWGRAFVRIDKFWTKFEIALCTATLLLEVLAMTLWVTLKGLAPGAELAGPVLRGILGATTLGTIGYLATFKLSPRVRNVAATVGVLLGFASVKLWGSVGLDWTSNVLNWFQQASLLTLVGGLRGVGTRLTVLLAVLGGSLATAAGRHVTIDLVTRYLKPNIRLPVVVAGWLATSVICAAASWGFFDHIAIENFGAQADASPRQKIAVVGHELGQYAFVTKAQIALDLKTLPRVLRGEVYSQWLTGTEWDRFLDQLGFVQRYGKEAVDALRIPPDGVRSPIVAIPGKGEPRGVLTEAANLAFPIGFFVIALRFILLSILALSGHMKVDSEAHMDLGTKREGAANLQV